MISGRVGTAVALRAKMFGFEVIFYDPYVVDGIEKSLGITRTDNLDEILSKSDCISLHCTLNEHTHHLINDSALHRMKKGAFLVNTACGGLLDEHAVANALKLGVLKGVALDCLENEPFCLTDSPLSHAPNVICTPNCSWFSDKSCIQVRREAAQEMLRGLTSKIPDGLRNCVNKVKVLDCILACLLSWVKINVSTQILNLWRAIENRYSQIVFCLLSL